MYEIYEISIGKLMNLTNPGTIKCFYKKLQGWRQFEKFRKRE